MEYTKGEWIVNEVYRCIQSHDDDIPLFAICYFGNHVLERKNIANANLIASAPKLDRYREYVDAKIDIDEVPLRFDEFEEITITETEGKKE